MDAKLAQSNLQATEEKERNIKEKTLVGSNFLPRVNEKCFGWSTSMKDEHKEIYQDLSFAFQLLEEASEAQKKILMLEAQEKQLRSQVKVTIVFFDFRAFSLPLSHVLALIHLFKFWFF